MLNRGVKLLRHVRVTIFLPCTDYHRTVMIIALLCIYTLVIKVEPRRTLGNRPAMRWKN